MSSMMLGDLLHSFLSRCERQDIGRLQCSIQPVRNNNNSVEFYSCELHINVTSEMLVSLFNNKCVCIDKKENEDTGALEELLEEARVNTLQGKVDQIQKDLKDIEDLALFVPDGTGSATSQLDKIHSAVKGLRTKYQG